MRATAKAQQMAGSSSLNSALASSVCIGFGGGFGIGFVLLCWLCLPVAAVAIMTVCVDFQGIRCNNCVSMLSS